MKINLLNRKGEAIGVQDHSLTITKGFFIISLKQRLKEDKEKR